MRRLLSLLFIPMLFAEVTEANTGVFFGAGNQVIPIKNTAVQLVTEKVQMKILIEKDNGKFGVPFIPWVNVTATFNLKNTSKRPEKLQMGFPFLNLRGFGDEKAVISNMGFEVLSDGKELKSEVKGGVIQTKLDPEGLFKKVFVWNDEFTSLQTKQIVVKYKMLMGVGSMSSVMRNFNNIGQKYYELDKLFSALGYNFFYITKTAHTWKGSVETAEFEVDCKDFLNELSNNYLSKYITIMNENKKFALDNRDYQERLNNAGQLLSTMNRPVFLESHSPADYKTADGVYSWKFEKSVPSDGISLNFIILFIPSALSEVNAFVKTASAQVKQASPGEFGATLRTYYRIISSTGEPQDDFSKGYLKEMKWLLNKPVLIFPKDRTSLKEISDFLNQ